MAALQSKVFSHGTAIVGLGAKLKAGKQLVAPGEILDRAHEGLPINAAKRKGKPTNDETEEGEGEEPSEEPAA